MRESVYQAKLIKKLERLFPGCLVLKNDSGYMQGIPDISIFYGDRWAMLEVKVSEEAAQQPNQDHYVQQAADMSFGAVIFPENEEEVLGALQQALGSRRKTRVPKPE